MVDASAALDNYLINPLFKTMQDLVQIKRKIK
jgi:hypothetical protein